MSTAMMPPFASAFRAVRSLAADRFRPRVLVLAFFIVAPPLTGLNFWLT